MKAFCWWPFYVKHMKATHCFHCLHTEGKLGNIYGSYTNYRELLSMIVKGRPIWRLINVWISKSWWQKEVELAQVKIGQTVHFVTFQHSLTKVSYQEIHFEKATREGIMYVARYYPGFLPVHTGSKSTSSDGSRHSAGWSMPSYPTWLICHVKTPTIV